MATDPISREPIRELTKAFIDKIRTEYPNI
jgi:hypothetical protein